MKIPLCVPDIGQEEIDAITEVLKSGWLAHGPKNEAFEEAFAKYIGVEHAVSVNSCTSALQLALLANDITGEVILPSFTWVASANSIVTSGATPIFADIEEKSCNIDPASIKRLITPKTQAVMPVHYAGQCCRMDEIQEIADKHDLLVIEDSAETLGGAYKGKKAGSFGIGCFSFYPTKNITTGEGGMLTTDDDGLAKKARALRAHGLVSSAFDREKKEKPWLRSASYAGYNFRLCDILAALGVVQMKKLDEMNKRRRSHAEHLLKGLGGMENISLPEEQQNCRHVYQMFTLKLDPSVDRTAFVQELRGKGIGASVHFDPPVHKQPFYAKLDLRIPLPVTEKVADTIVTLPMYPQMTKEQLDYMVGSIRELLP